MDFTFSEEQEILRDSVNAYLRDRYDYRRQTTPAARAATWRDWADLGWLGLPIAEARGGLGLGALELSILFEAFGRANVVEPYLETVVLAGGLVESAGTATQADRLLPAMIAGDLQAAFAEYDQASATLSRSGGGWSLNGTKTVVANGSEARLLVVPAVDDEGTSRLALVPAGHDGVSMRCYATIDGRQAADIRFVDVGLTPEDVMGTGGIDTVLDRARLAAAAETFGAMQGLLDATISYTRDRKQFGQSISQFQVLQHRMADMFIAVELLRGLLYAAAWAQDAGHPDAPMLTSALKVKADTAGRFVAHSAVQLHGAIATTQELSVGQYMKRLLVLSQSFGGTRREIGRFSVLRSHRRRAA
jgi:hypothetical protein